MSASKVNAYKVNAVTTQTPGQIVVLLYEGAIRFLHQAVTALEEKKYGQKGRMINRAIDIICELNSALDMDAGGEISQNLRKLYMFMHEYLLKANYQKDARKIQVVIDMLDDLATGWRQIAA